MIRLVLPLTAAIMLSSTYADPVTISRIGKLPLSEQHAWTAYLELSQTNALTDEAALQSEVKANKMTNALRAPSAGDFKLSAKVGDPWYAGDAAKQLANAVLSYQTPSGGWSKHTDYSQGPRQPGMQWTSQNEPGHSAHYVATFDNRSTTEQLNFLAYVWNATKREDCKAAFHQGLKFILAAQYPNGGWPQVYPLEGGYHDDMTFNDDAMTHILELLYAITCNDSAYAFLEDAERQKAADALATGLACVLKAQVTQDGKKTAWCAQYDALTLQPSSARKMEPATLSGLESARLLKFLMTIRDPSPKLVAGIDAGLTWLEDVRITGMTKMKVEGKTAYEPDPDSTEVYWARFYNLTNSQPVFPGRDGVLYISFETMAANNKLGYDFMSTLPGSIIKKGQKKWRRMVAKQSLE